MKLNVGCGWRDFGRDWIHVDAGDYSHLDSTDITLPEYAPNTADLIYASHVIEYFDRCLDRSKKLPFSSFIEIARRISFFSPI